ncbi:D-alanyl-D-alanine carboxypeptidase family protein [Chitiniphilus purpureus]|uniref:D-alanyl-D-alanine carboxypeptidase family protein n=1 Tax=Chitiniphilus purpureus TaxID=2981137 RepID=A0ABY6DMQ9_9NEIS|nr:M15 family metallopeptidase [Chitiniphilus sp. CD1]UXY15660.1 D-alanyl-D-alanine carboxypeptidase family protein [Chitiniphilus sp. CD1]
MNESLRAIWQELGIAEAILAEKRLCIYEEATALVDVETGLDGRVWQLTVEAAAAWRAMQAAAAGDGVTLRIASAYRATARQGELIRRKLDAGQPLSTILQVLAPPGCSEHHTGRAVDVFSPGGPVVEEAFEQTPAFAWLQAHASQFGFTLSFPRDNRYGYVYEPWHWCYQPPAQV